ncbi:MAG: ThiF family adenylyltransferase [Rickettsiales bacterium]|jgi:molybdopterin/thiamine biosynthesis adenylyltransferase
MTSDFNYEKAFHRNLGLVTPQEQEKLRNSTVALAGGGGTGGITVITLARMGIANFKIADFDEFSIANFNRQAGANMQTLDKNKAISLKEAILAINPEAQVTTYEDGITKDNINDFLQNADIVIDAIDFFAMEAHELLHDTVHDLKKTVVFSAPPGFSATLHVFAPESMSFRDYFDIRDGMSKFDKMIAWAAGIFPSATHWKYMDTSPKRINAQEHVAPSICSAVNLSSSLMSTEIFIILLNRRPPLYAPQYMQFDLYRGVLRKGKLRFGNRGPIQQLKRFILSKKFTDQKDVINNKN